MEAKTFDRQTAKFLAVVGENMSELSGGEMQWWIQHPKALQETLKKAFYPPEEEAIGIVKSRVSESHFTTVAVQAIGVSNDILVCDGNEFWGKSLLDSANIGGRVKLVVRLIKSPPKNYLKIVGVKEVIRTVS